MTTTPVAASVQDNLQSALAKIIGQKNETTTKANYNNASIAAKLNYLETVIASSSGGVPRCVESGSIEPGVTETFTGPGELYVCYYSAIPNFVVDGVTIHNDFVYMVDNEAWTAHRIPFREQCVVSFSTNNSSPRFSYSYHKY